MYDQYMDIHMDINMDIHVDMDINMMIHRYYTIARYGLPTSAMLKIPR